MSRSSGFQRRAPEPPGSAHPGAQTRSGSGPSDAALVVEAQAGERWAQEALFRRYARMVNAMAFRLIGHEDVDDLVQDSFVEALRSLHRLSEPRAFSSWLGSIVVRTAHKRLRRRRLRQRLGLARAAAIDLDTVVGPSAPPDVALELRAIYSVLETLTVEQRLCLILRRVEGMKLEEVAHTMKLSLATVKRRLTVAEKAVNVMREAAR